MFRINTALRAITRYDMAKFVEFDQDAEVFDFLQSYMVKAIKDLPSRGQYRVQKEEGRMDLVSYAIYKDTQYWWILMVYNDLVAPHEVITGQVIEYPLAQDIEALVFSLRKQNGKQQYDLSSTTDVLVAPTDIGFNMLRFLNGPLMGTNVPFLPGFKYGEAKCRTGQLYVFWTLNSGNEDAVNIERSVDGSPFQVLAALVPGSSSYFDANVPYSHLVAYRVQVVRSKGASEYTSILTIDATSGTVVVPDWDGQFVST